MNSKPNTNLSPSLIATSPSPEDLHDVDVPKVDLLNLDMQMCFALYSASLSMTKVYKPLLDKLQITYPQYLVMMVLWEKDGVMVNTLCEKLFSDSGTVTPLLKRLEKQGLVQRIRSVEDERKVMITLTSAGRALKQEAAAVPMQIICSTECTLDEIQALNKQLIDLRGSLIKHVQKKQ